MKLNTWIWTMPSSHNSFPFVHYDNRNSKIPSYRITHTDRVDQKKRSDIILKAPDRKIRNLQNFGCIPSILRCPIVNQTMAAIIQSMAGDDVQFNPVLIRAKDGDSTEYCFARPLAPMPCTDLEKSDIVNWIIPGKTILDARILVFQDDCLEGKHLARDQYSLHVAVSDRLRRSLLETEDKGLAFQRPEDLWNIFR